MHVKRGYIEEALHVQQPETLFQTEFAGPARFGGQGRVGGNVKTAGIGKDEFLRYGRETVPLAPGGAQVSIVAHLIVGADPENGPGFLFL